MAKLTVAEIKKQIAALEAKAARLAEEEKKASVAKVRALMNQLGVTLEHLSAAVARKGAAVRKAIVGKKPATAKRAGKRGAKYQDPKTGATWSGFGRAPGWIAGVANRDAFLVGTAPGHGVKTGTSAPVAKKKMTEKETSPKKASAKMGVKASAKRATISTKKVASKATKPATSKKRPAIKAAMSKKSLKKKSVSGGAAEATALVDSSAASAT